MPDQSLLYERGIKTERLEVSRSRNLNKDVTNDLAALIAVLLHTQCVSVRQFTAALRTAAVRFEASRYPPGKTNKARAAFSTGLTRGDVARLLKCGPVIINNDFESIISVWLTDVRFLDPNGEPADLPIFGRSRSFEHIVELKGKGIPVRAILDEFIDRGAVTILRAQKVRLQRSFLKVDQKLSREIAAFLQTTINGLSAEESRPTNHGISLRRGHLKRKAQPS